MKLRQAIKIQRVYQEPCKRNGKLRRTGIKFPYNENQYRASASVCNKHFMDKRVPYIPTDDEREEKGLIMLSMLAECFIDDPDELEEVKNSIWES